MKTTVTLNTFVDAFRQAGRDNFSRDGLVALFEHLEELEESCGVELELDVIALCCDFTEYDTLESAANDYSLSHDETLEYLRDHTTFIEIDGGLIVQDF